MAVRATFTGFDPYKLNGVTVTSRVLEHGSYATVLELEYMGLKCAGKKIHEVLLEQGGASYSVRRFEEECRLLSQVRHPNVVQFLGVHFQQRVPAPILVMEFLPTNLTSCIEQYGILLKEISYSILHDVVLGLCYLHDQTPPIIHRDLSSNNVLLTPNMTAKISDLGVARILNLTPLQVSRMTQTPGTPAYMPPEVMIANPKYDTSVDEFSYGILMIHIFSGRWPEPQVGQTRFEDGQLVPVTEAERREVFLRAIGNDHLLMDLILKCIDNHPQTRAHASEIVERLAEIELQFPASFTNRLEMLRQIYQLKEEKQTLKIESETVIQRKEEQIQQMIEEAQRNSSETDRLKMNHSSVTTQLQVQVEDLKSQKKQLKSESEAEVEELKSKAALFEAQIETNGKLLQDERETSKTQLVKAKEHFETQMQKDRERYKVELSGERYQLAKEREVNEKLVGDNRELQSDLSKLKSENYTHQNTISKLETDLSAKGNAILQNGVSMKKRKKKWKQRLKL